MQTLTALSQHEDTPGRRRPGLGSATTKSAAGGIWIFAVLIWKFVLDTVDQNIDIEVQKIKRNSFQSALISNTRISMSESKMANFDVDFDIEGN